AATPWSTSPSAGARAWSSQPYPSPRRGPRRWSRPSSPGSRPGRASPSSITSPAPPRWCCPWSGSSPRPPPPRWAPPSAPPHAPGMAPLHPDRTGAAYTTGNFHKWLCAPKGAAFLHVRRGRQARIHPLSISHGRNSPREGRSRFRLEHDWTGTFDPAPFLCVPEAIRFLESLLPGGLPAWMDHNRTAALAARRTLSAALHVPLPCPDEMIGAMASLP